MKRILVFILIFGVLVLLDLFYWNRKISQAPSQTGGTNQNIDLGNTLSNSEPLNSNSNLEKIQNSNQNQNRGATLLAGIYPPLDQVKERVNKKTFGLFITPANSPVQPERFSGYHTGIDLEIFPNELNVEVPVLAACTGQIKMKKTATGYGGVVVTSCQLEGQDITVVYGHLKLSSISKKIGDSVQAGEKLGILGAAYSPETDGERKHLHLSFHKGTSVNILGYVQNQAELKNWLDPCIYLCQ